tara:strand:- start:604 stop:789 length:186 start_codon:yes stop_codon:yes gene_type:complete
MSGLDDILNNTTKVKVDTLGHVLDFIGRDDFKSKTFGGVVKFINEYKEVMQAQIDGKANEK